MGDTELGWAIAQGNLTAVGDAYSGYGQSLFDYCQSQLADTADAAQVVQDTFVVTAASASLLREPNRLRAWLFSIARRACLLRLWSGAMPAFTDELLDGWENPGTTDWEADIVLAAWTALADMKPLDREVVELTQRVGLDTVDLGLVLGVTHVRARLMARTTAARFETSVDLLLADRRGEPWYCETVSGLLRTLNGDHSRVSPRWLRTHSVRCRVCGQRRRNLPPSEEIISLLPAASLTARDEQQLIEFLGDGSPSAETNRADIVMQMGQFGPDGFPERVPPPQGGSERRYLMIAAAAVLVVALASGGAVLVSTHSSSPPPAASATNGAPSTSAAASPSATAKPSPSIAQILQPTASKSASPKASASKTTKPSPSASATKDTTAPVITITPRSQTITAPGTDGAVADFTTTVTDNVDGANKDTVTCDPASGSTFPVGRTTVTCTATDKAGNQGTATATVTVTQLAPSPSPSSASPSPSPSATP